MIELKIDIPSTLVEHIPEKSFYNHNYYKLISGFPWFISDSINVLYEEYDGLDERYATYSMGYFNENDFVTILQWNGEAALIP